MFSVSKAEHGSNSQVACDRGGGRGAIGFLFSS